MCININGWKTHSHHKLNGYFFNLFLILLKENISRSIYNPKIVMIRVDVVPSSSFCSLAIILKLHLDWAQMLKIWINMQILNEEKTFQHIQRSYDIILADICFTHTYSTKAALIKWHIKMFCFVFCSYLFNWAQLYCFIECCAMVFWLYLIWNSK